MKITSVRDPLHQRCVFIGMYPESGNDELFLSALEATCLSLGAVTVTQIRDGKPISGVWKSPLLEAAEDAHRNMGEHDDEHGS
jgi:hypothetical protein